MLVEDLELFQPRTYGFCDRSLLRVLLDPAQSELAGWQ